MKKKVVIFSKKKNKNIEFIINDSNLSAESYECLGMSNGDTVGVGDDDTED